MAERWQRQRGAWVMERAGRRPARRRRGEKLLAAARRTERTASGLGAAAREEVSTPGALRRSVVREDGAGNTAGWLAWTVVWAGALALVAGPALAIGAGLYGAWVALARTRLGPPRAALALAGAALSLVVAALWWALAPPTGFGAQPLAAWIVFQAVGAWAWAALSIRRCGWAAVASRSAVRSAATVRPARAGAPRRAEQGDPDDDPTRPRPGATNAAASTPTTDERPAVMFTRRRRELHEITSETTNRSTT